MAGHRLIPPSTSSPGQHSHNRTSHLEDDDWPHRELRLGFDSAGRLLEVVVLTFKNDDELVIHAMPARKQYRRLLPWR